MNKWQKLARLSPRDGWVLFRASLLLHYARVRLPLVEFRASVPRAQDSDDPATSPALVAQAQRIATLVAVAAGHGVIDFTCLHRSLVLWWLLRERDIPCDLRIGVRRVPGPFEAHAWVEYAGVALNDSADLAKTYGPFAKAVEPSGFRAPWGRRTHMQA